TATGKKGEGGGAIRPRPQFYSWGPISNRPHDKASLLLAALGQVDEVAAAAAGAAAQLALAARRRGRRRRRAARRRRLGGLLLFLLLGPVQALAAEADLAVVDVHAEDLDLQLVADLDDVLGAIDLVVGQLADVQQPFQAGLELDEDAEVGE